jgi:cytochrome c-type biogenesis protein CcmH/NrfF
LVVVTPFVGALAWVWPLALIVVGAYLILRRSGASSAPLEVVRKQTEEADASTALEAGDERASRDVISR